MAIVGRIMDTLDNCLTGAWFDDMMIEYKGNPYKVLDMATKLYYDIRCAVCMEYSKVVFGYDDEKRMRDHFDKIVVKHLGMTGESNVKTTNM